MSEYAINLTTDISYFSIALSIICAVCIIFSWRVNRRYSQLVRQLMVLQNDFRAMTSGQLGMGRKIRQVSEEIANVENIQQQNPTHLTSEKVYQQAGLLLSRGATIEEVVESCQIAPAEAELIAIMSHSAPTYQAKNKPSKVA